MSEFMVQHQPEQQNFVLAWQGQQARLDYLFRPAQGDLPAVVNFTHTYVPPQFRGQGLAEQLVKAGLSWARQQDYQIVASCSYVAKFLR